MTRPRSLYSMPGGIAAVIGHCRKPVMPAWMKPLLMVLAMFTGALGPCRVPSSLSHSGRPLLLATGVDSQAYPVVERPQVSCDPYALSAALKFGSAAAAAEMSQVLTGL